MESWRLLTDYGLAAIIIVVVDESLARAFAVVGVAGLIRYRGEDRQALAAHSQPRHQARHLGRVGYQKYKMLKP